MRLGTEKFIVHILGFKSPTVSVLREVGLGGSLHKAAMVCFAPHGGVDMWLTSQAAVVPGALHVYKGLLLILGICSLHGKGVSCNCLFTDGELDEMTKDFLGATQGSETYVSQLGKEHNFP